jgi:hypothetical protein
MRSLVRLLVAMGLVAGVVVIGAPGSEAASKPPTVTVVGIDFSFRMPDTIRPGWTTINFENQGTQGHEAQLAALNKGVTPAQFKAALATAATDHGAAAKKLVHQMMGALAADPGQSESAPFDLKAANYVAICFQSGDDNIPHYVKGMIKFFTVAGSPNGASAPTVSATITAKDFYFVIPKNVKGTGTIAFANRGTQPHELGIVKLKPGATLEQVKTSLLSNAPPSDTDPFTVVAGMPPIQPKQTDYLNLTLAKGDYAAVCFVTDPKTNKPHLALGMITPFTIS